jgi:16S rRNA A1518/A1519 N6-dimethyltransferase RsmA/KsgA/DIM1 with predicted DNA glycosylase/AP lyase activity
LGQHYLIDPSVVTEMIGLAAVQKGERVIEIGTGRGALTRELVGLTANLEGYEIDKESYEELQRELAGTSLILHNEDAFESSPEFDVLLSSLPYSESSNFIGWLSQRRYDRAVVLLQRDFATKIAALPGSPEYRAVSVISQASARVEIVSSVGRGSFDPPPRVNSCLVTMWWRKTLRKAETAMIKRIFSQKRRTVRAALKSLGLAAPPSAPAPTENLPLQCRVNSLRPESVLAMIGVLERAEQARNAEA